MHAAGPDLDDSQHTKVLVLAHSSELGGAEIGLAHLANELRGNLEVAVFEEGPLVDRLRAQGHRPHVLGITRGSTSLGRDGSIVGRTVAAVGQAVDLRRSLRRVVEQSGATVLVLNTLRGALLTAMSGVRVGIPIVVMVRDGLRPPYLGRTDSLLTQVLVNLRAAAIVANSSWTRSTIHSVRPTHVVAPVLARELYDPVVPRPGETVRVLVLGRLATWKGQHVALAAAGLMDTPHDWSLTIAGAAWFGEEEYARTLRSQADELGMPVDFVGHVENVKGLIDDHDVVVHASVMPEPFGQVVAQGMARGRLVIASDAGGPSSIVDHEVDGLLVTPGDILGLAAALVRAVEDGDMRARIGAAARDSAARFHPDVTTRALHLILRQAGSRRVRLAPAPL